MKALYPKGNGIWEGEWETEEGGFFVRVPDAVLRRHYQEALVRLGISTDEPDQLIKEAQRLRDRQLAVWLQVKEIDYWRAHPDPEVKIRQFHFEMKPNTAPE